MDWQALFESSLGGSIRADSDGFHAKQARDALEKRQAIITLMNGPLQKLKDLCKQEPQFLNKGGLCVALIVTQAAIEKGLPLNPDALRTKKGGQVAGLGKSAVQKILNQYGITQVLAEEGGRTSRGSLGLMEAYVEVLNGLQSVPEFDLQQVMAWWIQKVREHFARQGPKFHFDPSKSVRANLEELLQQARELQENAQGTHYVGAMLQYLIGAKLDLVLGDGQLKHHAASAADHSTKRSGDYQIDNTILHITTHPTEALVRKCNDNLKNSLKPVILTLGQGVTTAVCLLENAGADERVDVLDAVQFLTANVYERSLFKVKCCKVTLANLLKRYNEIVEQCETDASLKVNIPDASAGD